jgi:hypothetical protein
MRILRRGLLILLILEFFFSDKIDLTAPGFPSRGTRIESFRWACGRHAQSAVLLNGNSVVAGRAICYLLPVVT